MTDARESNLNVVHETKYLAFVRVPSKNKTGIWEVLNRRNAYSLGVIKWYGAWRQYTFWPAPETIFNRGCLDNINAFMDTQMRLRRAS